jgi:hypothetical protein
MALRTLALMLVIVLAVGFRAALSVQGQASQLSVEAFFIDPPRVKTPPRLWLRITNGSRRAQILCRSSWGYTWISDDPQAEPAIEEKSSLHGCGDDSHDPFWLLLPGESRFDSYEVSGPAGPNATLEVGVDVMHHPVDVPGPGERATLSWKGRVADAIALGLKFRGR